MRYAIFALLIVCGACYEKKGGVLFRSYSEDLDSLKAKNQGLTLREITVVNLCELFNKDKWDSIAIILPYLPDKELNHANLCGMPDVLDSMRRMNSDDGKTGLLFLKNGCIISYAIVSANPNFSQLFKKGDVAIHFQRRSSCKIKLLTSRADSSEEVSLFFLPEDFELSDSASFREPNKSLESLFGDD